MFPPPPPNQSCGDLTHDHGSGGTSAVPYPSIQSPLGVTRLDVCCSLTQPLGAKSCGWPLGQEDGKVAGQSQSSGRTHQQPRVRAARAAAPAVVWEQRLCLETPDSQLCGEELSLCVQLMKITLILLGGARGRTRN